MATIKKNFEWDDMFDPKKISEQVLTEAIKKKYPGKAFTVSFNVKTSKFKVTGLTPEEVAAVPGINTIAD